MVKLSIKCLDLTCGFWDKSFCSAGFKITTKFLRLLTDEIGTVTCHGYLSLIQTILKSGWSTRLAVIRPATV